MADEEIEEPKQLTLVDDDEPQRRSLLDVIKINVGKTIQFRLVLLSRIANDVHGNAAATEDFFESVITKNQTSPGGLTGLLLVYPVQCVAVIEGTYDAVQSIIGFFSEEENYQGRLSNVRILVVSSNIRRQYKLFHKKELNLVAPRVEGDYNAAHPIETVVVEVLSQLSAIGNHLAAMSQLAATKALDTIQEQIPEAIVSQDILGYLLNQREVPSPAEYRAMYEKPLKVKLDADVVWPMRQRLLDQFEQ
jgi:hypothetical protein